MKRFQTAIRYIGGILLCDCVADAQFEASLDFTEHPIDDASTISDHAVRKPETFTLTLTQTQTPLRKIDGFSPQGQPLQVMAVGYGKQKTTLKIAQKGGVQPSVSGLIEAGLSAVKNSVPKSIEGLKVLPAAPKNLSVTVLKADAPVDRIGTFFDQLLKLLYAVERLTLSVKGRDFSDFVLTSVRKSDRPGGLGKSSFDVSLKKVATVATKQVTLPAVPKAKAKKDRGVQYGPPLPPVTEDSRRKTAAAALVDMARGG